MGIKKFALLTTLAIVSAGTVAFASASPTLPPKEPERIKDPTCMEEGIERNYYGEKVEGAKQDENGYYYTEDVIPKVGHDLEWKVTTKATCTMPGVETGTCKYGCGYTETKVIPAGHKYQWYAGENAYVCGYEGTIVERCSICGLTSGRTQKVKGDLEHIWVVGLDGKTPVKYKDAEALNEGTNEGTCIKEETWYQVCTRCNQAVLQKGEKDLDNHNYGDIQPDPDGEPTCMEEGHGYRLCSDCKKARLEAVIPKLQHKADLNNPVLDAPYGKLPTCTEPGAAWYHCVYEACDHSIIMADNGVDVYTTKIEPLGHNVVWVERNGVDEHGKTMGYWVAYCTRCEQTVDYLIDDKSPLATFTDVNPGNWAYTAVQFVANNKLMIGKGNQKFEPDANITRAEFVQILYAAANKPKVATTSKFSDVEEGAWYADAANWMASMGFVSGYPDGTFGVSDPITREQVAAILYKVAPLLNTSANMSSNVAIGRFTDVPQISVWAVTPLQWAVGQEIISGTADNRLAPTESATRAQCAQMIMKFMTQVVQAK